MTDTRSTDRGVGFTILNREFRHTASKVGEKGVNCHDRHQYDRQRIGVHDFVQVVLSYSQQSGRKGS